MLLAPTRDIPKIVDQYPEYLRKKGASERYTKQMTTCLNHFINQKMVISTEAVDEFLSEKNKMGYRTPYYRTVFSLLYKMLGHYELVDTIPKYRTPSVVFKPTHSKEDLIKIIDNIKEPGFNLISKILYDSGCRSSEVISVRKDSLEYDPSKDILLIHSIGKGGEPFTFFVSKRTEEEILEFFNKSDRTYPFIRTNSKDFDTGVRTNYVYYQNALKEAAKPVIGNKKIGSHDFRRRLGTELYNKTKDLITVQRFLRHKSPIPTQRYIGQVDMDILKTIRELRG